MGISHKLGLPELYQGLDGPHTPAFWQHASQAQWVIDDPILHEFSCVVRLFAAVPAAAFLVVVVAAYSHPPTNRPLNLRNVTEF
jgi:hypothetical protein